MANWFFILFGFLAFLSLPIESSWGNDTIEGVPTVIDSSTLSINGRLIRLWGVEGLLGEQKCWKDETPWACGEYGREMLKHYIGERQIQCTRKAHLPEGHCTAVCIRTDNGVAEDVGNYIISIGWALDKPAESGGQYGVAQEEARMKRRGVWESVFQKPSDWISGRERFMNYDMAPAEPTTGGSP
jgi:endonuclease YncB( thermonuclease family)